MVTKKQKTRTVILIVILALVIVAGVFAISYYMNGYKNPLQLAATQEEELTEAQPEQTEEVVVEDTTETTVDEVKPETTETEVKAADTTEDTDTAAKTEDTKATDTKSADTKATDIDDTKIEPVADKLSYYGALKVVDGKLCNKNGEEVQLTGVSSHNLSWYPEYITDDSITFLRDTYGINVIRLAVYTSDYNGYCVGGEEIQESVKDTIDQAVTSATDNDMYVIIDWHILNDGNPNTYKAEAIQFFGEMVRRYAENENVIYEICNEPNGDTTWEDIKAYANEVIPVIRNVDKDALILVGTPNWCQDIESATADPLDFDNIMYTFHFYSSTHKSLYRNRLMEAVESGTPVFVSEYGLSEADGDGKIDTKEATNWLELMTEYKLSSCIWNLSNKDETSALISADCDKLTDWTEDDLSYEGQFIYEYLTSKEKDTDDN